MNKKLFASAALAVSASLSSGFAAATTYDNSVTYSAQTKDALVNPGGTARANSIVIISDGSDMASGSKIVVRLPDGLNFASDPKFSVTQDTANEGLTLVDDTSFEDPTLGSDDNGDPNVGISLGDYNGDGGNDRAEITVSGAAEADDVLVAHINVVADADAEVGSYNASVIVAGNLANTVKLVDVIATPLTSVVESGEDLITLDQRAADEQDTTDYAFHVIIPAGAENGDTVTLTPEGKVLWDDGTSTLTITDIYTPVDVAPLTGTIVTGTAVDGTTGTVTLTLQGAPDGGWNNEVNLVLELNSAGIGEGSAVGDYGITVAGTAGVSGTVDFFSVSENGSSAALLTGAELTEIVVGSSAAQTLPAIVITENFDGDALDGTPTVTITAGDGLSFVANQTATITVGDATLLAGGTSTSSVIVLNLADAAGTTKTITISDIKAIVESDATGNQSVTVGGAAIDSATGPAGDVIEVSTAVAVGHVTVTGPTSLGKVGPDTAANTASVSLSESTYGSLTRANYSSTTTATGTTTTEAYFSVVATGADVTAVSVVSLYEEIGSAPVIDNGGVCEVEEAGSDTYVCVLTAESTALTGGAASNTITVDVTYTTTGAVGDTVSLTMDGNAGVAGSVDVATISESTTMTQGEIPILTEGLTSAQELGTFTITENFDGGLGAGTFRLLAPAGVVFDSASAGLIFNGATPTAIVSTFGVDDTLEISTAATPSLTVSGLEVSVSGSVSGYLEFQIIDGTSGTTTDKTGLTNVSAIWLGYADQSLTALDAGSAIAINAGFHAENTISGGLVGEGYEVSSGDEDVATAMVEGDTLVVSGVAAGATTVTVTDELGAEVAVAVTVSAGAAQPTAAKVVGADDAAFSAGATSDGGDTYAETFTAGDMVDVLASIDVDPAHQGLAGAIHVGVLVKLDDGTNSLNYLDENGDLQPWDPAGLPGALLESDALEASYSLNVWSGEVAAGTYRFAVAYTAIDGDDLVLVYAPKAVIFTVE
jgi:hypothetical protein